MDDPSIGVVIWWTALGTVGIANIGAWCAAARRFADDRTTESPQVHAARRRQLVLSAVFVAGCAFRSLFPRAEAQRTCLYDSWISSAMISRSVATIAEICMVAQWALVLRKFATDARASFAATVSLLMIPLIAVAEVCSWYTALTTNFLGSVLEESLWAITSTLATLGFLTMWSRYRGSKRRFIGTAIAINAVYVAFMCTVDVRMYLSRWRADEVVQRRYLTLNQGWRDSQHRSIVTRRWIDWRQEMPWMSLYFSAGVWISIGLTRVPRVYRDAPSA